MDAHTYTLTNRGFVPPRWFNQRLEPEVIVKHPRNIEIEGLSLCLLDGEPDLPVGKKVKIWLRKWFQCETLEFIEHQELERQRKTKEREDHEKAVETEAVAEYLTPTKELLESNPSKQQIKETLDQLYQSSEKLHRTYKAYWHSFDHKQKSNDASIGAGVVAQAKSAISEYLFKKIKMQGVEINTAYAYSPREGASDGFFSPGRDHLQLQTDVVIGRLKRSKHDALCKPRKKFWSLEGFDDRYSVTCKTCLYRMINFAYRED